MDQKDKYRLLVNDHKQIICELDIALQEFDSVQRAAHVMMKHVSKKEYKTELENILFYYQNAIQRYGQVRASLQARIDTITTCPNKWQFLDRYDEDMKTLKGLHNSIDTDRNQCAINIQRIASMK